LSLYEEIENTECLKPSLWWLGQNSFVVKHHHTVFYIDPLFSRPDSLISPGEVTNADLILASNLEPRHFDPPAIQKILERSPKAKLVLPKSTAPEAFAAGIDYSRMTTTDSGLRVEYFRGGEYSRIYAIPAAFSKDSGPPALHWSPLGGFPHLCYLIRFGNCTIYHSGGTIPYDELAERLRPYNVTIALVPAGESMTEFAQLAADISARWVIPMESDPEKLERFTEHMLGHRPAQRFKLMGRGECWSLP
jgi:L-ascorbate metabolism protein UlaG (beta-lactamase superfamily)